MCSCRWQHHRRHRNHYRLSLKLNKKIEKRTTRFGISGSGESEEKKTNKSININFADLIISTACIYHMYDTCVVTYRIKIGFSQTIRTQSNGVCIREYCTIHKFISSSIIAIIYSHYLHFVIYFFFSVFFLSYQIYISLKSRTGKNVCVTKERTRNARTKKKLV